MALTFSDVFEAKLRQLVAERMESLTENIARGGAQDYPNYREWVGELRGLEQISELCDEARKLTEER